MIRKFEIENIASGLVFGVFEGRTEAEALDAFAKDAGYRDYAHCQSVVTAKHDEISCREI